MPKPAIAWNHHESVWQAVLPEGTVVRHKSLSVLEDFLEYLDLQRQQGTEQQVRDCCRPTQKQADAVSIVAACAAVCAILALVAFGVSQWS